MSILKGFGVALLKLVAACAALYGYFMGVTGLFVATKVFESGTFSVFMLIFFMAVVIFVAMIYFAYSMGAKKVRDFLISSALWFFSVYVLFSVWFGYRVVAHELRTSEPVGIIVLTVLGFLIGGYIVYLLAGHVGAFIGLQFEKLGNAQAKGRPTMLAEMLNSGYSKPQTRAFANELNSENAGVVYVYTTFVLYGIPLIAFAGTLFELSKR